MDKDRKNEIKIYGILILIFGSVLAVPIGIVGNVLYKDIIENPYETAQVQLQVPEHLDEATHYQWKNKGPTENINGKEMLTIPENRSLTFYEEIRYDDTDTIVINYYKEVGNSHAYELIVEKQEYVVVFEKTGEK